MVPRRRHDHAGREIQKVENEFMRVLRLDPERRELPEGNPVY